MNSENLDAFERHYLSPSEIECRVAVARMNLTPAERLAKPVLEAFRAEEAASKARLKRLKEIGLDANQIRFLVSMCQGCAGPNEFDREVQAYLDQEQSTSGE